MSEKELIEYVLQTVAANPMIATDTGLEAVRTLGEIAEKERVEWALCGGLAMHLYGSDRLTKDVDIIASARISIEARAPLTFGGDSYTVEIGKYKIPVDWIVRNDGYQKYYRAALNEAVSLRQKNGVRVDRSKVRQNIVRIAGEDVWLAMLAEFRRLCDRADERASEPNKYYNQD